LKLTKAELPENVQKVVKKELKRIKKMSPQSPEYPMLRHYLELIADLPWNKSTKDNIDISKAREVKFTVSEKATKIDKIFTVNLTVCSNRQIDDEDFINF
jgi:ATP-dependent Lon protease